MPAKKTVKKPVKKTTKATVKKIDVKKAVAKAPVVEPKCECDGRCHCHGRAHCLKHIIVWAIIFALGVVCGKMLDCGHGFRHMPKMQPVFVDGCLSMESIKCPKMQEKLATADANGDNCISVEEFKAVKKEMRKHRWHHAPEAEAPKAE